MPLYARTPRRTIDHYDPKQRFVGGVVLCLIIILIYFILKVLISFSAVHDGRYKLASAREDEVLKAAAATTAIETPTHRVVGADGINTITMPPKSLRPLPSNFTFLDLDGNPMGKEQLAIEEEQAAAAKAKSAENGWTVHTAPFKTEESAKQVVDKLKEKGFESTVAKSGNKFIVSLNAVQPDKAAAQKYSKQIATQAGVKRLRIRENKPPAPAQPQ